MLTFVNSIFPQKKTVTITDVINIDCAFLWSCHYWFRKSNLYYISLSLSKI